MSKLRSNNLDPLKDDSDEDLGFHSMEFGDYKVEFECISKQRGRQIYVTRKKGWKTSVSFKNLGKLQREEGSEQNT